MNLGFVALYTGALDEVEPLFAEALRISRRIDDRVAQSYFVGGLGCHAAGSGQPRRAARLLGASAVLSARAGASVNGILAPLLVSAERSAVTALGAAAFAAEVTTGKALSRDAAMALALGESVPAAAKSNGTGAGPLGRRQAEVAHLVADGLSNKQIGARLFISERTVDSHVRTILTKLGFDSRAQIASWITAADR